MLKKDDLPTVQIWNSNPLPKPYSSSFLSFNTQYLQNKPNGLHILKNNNNNILKIIKDTENKYKAKNNNQCIHFISEKDYFDNGLIDVMIDNNNNNNNNNNNIFFIDEERTNTQCSECLSGTLEDIKSFDPLKGYKEYGYGLDSIQSLSKISDDDINNLSQCKECNILIDKNVNQIVNFQRKAYSILVTGKSPKYLKESLRISSFIFKCSDKFFHFLFRIIYYFILVIIDSFMSVIKFFVK
ncbi:hypothetical protein DDB_G0268050 [Dictyostelium discoideum AX4]|uniref:Uncharacterized protein n=1 Tax=Dictyostelium discoideum TaxID=44689 RepID=Q55FL9_DICDI|nr:hypothetical protein DDB_G0268050 [Dictyostelium discoideum AX4]EAL73478.1 hypothetical protein DDB_G0268050 [Dictyostelium discoideum AX4]|eukprot:XP_647514.1 hypothetical protein DDB_G0268050 [Dictyostelium discoideum AX4]